MYISIQGDIDAGMTENFAECFDIESEFHTSGEAFWNDTDTYGALYISLWNRSEDILFEEAHCFLWSAIIDLELEWFG